MRWGGWGDVMLPCSRPCGSRVLNVLRGHQCAVSFGSWVFDLLKKNFVSCDWRKIDFSVF